MQNDELLDLKSLFDWLEDNKNLLALPLERQYEGMAQQYANASIKAVSSTKRYLERYPDRVEFRTWLADQSYNPDLVRVIEAACSLKNVQTVTDLLQRLKKAHDYYDQCGDNKSKKAVVYQKAKPVIDELMTYGVDEAFCNLLLVFGGYFLTYEFKSQKKNIETEAKQAILDFTT